MLISDITTHSVLLLLVYFHHEDGSGGILRSSCTKLHSVTYQKTVNFLFILFVLSNCRTELSKATLQLTQDTVQSDTQHHLKSVPLNTRYKNNCFEGGKHYHTDLGQKVRLANADHRVKPET
jgi:hypothetical protein